MTEPSPDGPTGGGPCEPYATLDDLVPGCPCRVIESGGSTPDDDTLEELIGQATLILWALLAMPDFGFCERTIHPCRRTEPNRFPLRDRLGLLCSDCGTLDAVKLDGPVNDILEILVDGAIVDPSEYELHDGMWLVRTEGSWPAGGGPATDEAFVITYLSGVPIPAMIRDATIELVNQLWMDRCGSNDCQLPRAVSSLNTGGTSYQYQERDDTERVRDAGSNLPAVWRAISTFNPTMARMPTLVWSPEEKFRTRTIRTF